MNAIETYIEWINHVMNKCTKALVYIRPAACEPEAKVSVPSLSPEGADRELEDVAL